MLTSSYIRDNPKRWAPIGKLLPWVVFPVAPGPKGNAESALVDGPRSFPLRRGCLRGRLGWRFRGRGRGGRVGGGRWGCLLPQLLDAGEELVERGDLLLAQ